MNVPAAVSVPVSASPQDRDKTVRQLRATFMTGKTRSYAWREDQLEALAQMLDEREDDFATAINADMRRGIFEASLFDISPTKSEVRHALSRLRQWMKPQRITTPLATKPSKAWVHYEPLGVTLIVSPWNYPLHLALGPLVAALAAGNCAIIKPSELTPHCSTALAEIIPLYLDPDAVAVLEGGPDVTNGLIDQGLDHIFFTGSPAVGRMVMAAAAQHLTPVTLELGGKCPVVVTSSADIDTAVKRVAFGKLTNSGQTCVAPDYVLVDRQVRNEFVEKLTDTLIAFTEGRDLPILSEKYVARLRELIDTSGGSIAHGGTTNSEGREMGVTVITDPAPEADLMQEEIFGPVLPVMAVDSLNKAIEKINAGTRPLAAYLFTRDRQEMEKFIEGVPAGGININHVMNHLSVPELPFGGVGTSGTGKYHGRWGFSTFSNAKGILRQGTRVDLPLIYPPYIGLKRRIMSRGL